MVSAIEYALFGAFLKRQTSSSISLTFEEIEGILGDDIKLPPSAYTHEAWWANFRSHDLSRNWLEAGWRRPRGGLSLTGHHVRLEREEIPGKGSSERSAQSKDSPAHQPSPASVPPKVSADWHDLIADAVHIKIEPERDENGGVRRYQPQGDYANEGGLAFNRYGSGSFCRFRVPDDFRRAGVSLIVADDRLAYVGECEDFSKRFNTGYGQISPRNCYKGGQETNCRVNQLILKCAESGWSFDVYFIETADRLALETACINTYSPPWNRT